MPLFNYFHYGELDYHWILEWWEHLPKWAMPWKLGKERETPTPEGAWPGRDMELSLAAWTQDTGPAKALTPLCGQRDGPHLCSLSFSICELGIMSLSCLPHKEDEPKLTFAD